MGCGAKRPFHLQKERISFANELNRLLTVRYVNAENHRN